MQHTLIQQPQNGQTCGAKTQRGVQKLTDMVPGPRKRGQAAEEAPGALTSSRAGPAMDCGSCPIPLPGDLPPGESWSPTHPDTIPVGEEGEVGTV